MPTVRPGLHIALLLFTWYRMTVRIWYINIYIVMNLPYPVLLLCLWKYVKYRLQNAFVFRLRVQRYDNFSNWPNIPTTFFKNSAFFSKSRPSVEFQRRYYTHYLYDNGGFHRAVTSQLIFTIFWPPHITKSNLARWPWEISFRIFALGYGS